MKPKTKKKKNPQDLTLRNLRAMKKRISKTEEAMVTLTYLLSSYIGEWNCKDIVDLLRTKKRKLK